MNARVCYVLLAFVVAIPLLCFALSVLKALATGGTCECSP